MNVPYYVYPGVYRSDIDTVSEITQVSVKEIKSKSRLIHIVRARHLLFYVRFLRGAKLKAVASGTNITNHASVIHSIRAVKRRLQTEPAFRAVVAAAIIRLGLIEQHNNIINELKREFWIN